MTGVADDLVAATLATARALVAATALSVEVSAADVTLIQYRALVVLSTHGTLTISSLASAMQLAPSSATRLVERLERKELVARERSPASRREVNVRLTAAGAEYVEAVMAERRRRVVAILAEVPEGQRAPMLDAFRAFATAAGEPISSHPTTG